MPNLKTLLFSLVFLLTTAFLALAAEENLIITTYYPSPYGSYNELSTNKLAVGDTNEDTKLSSLDQPPGDGQAFVARSVIYKPQASLPVANQVRGELVYNNSDDSLYLYNGLDWAKQGAGSTCVTTYSSPPGACNCPEGWTLKLDLGSWGSCMFGDKSRSVFSPPGAGCPDLTYFGFPVVAKRTFGEACLCCQ